ncbi:glycosyltransferase [Limnohabitans sp. B9-3]|uniref:glycosyltransferase n=1 Tax=Limnohabitans sp. B9-3 TaxID=1100707 RepID=UPI000C1DCB6A|nr:glycosyltransferase [Limnohabitans sp. B9-3]PIT72395.1 hypothetical protein B9Z42_12660 [Limnohabitans sp. B9-3]
MKILWIHNWPEDRKSMGPFMWTVYNGLKESGHHIDMHYINGRRNIFSLFIEIIQLKKKLKRYELVHAQYGSLIGYIASKLGLPYIITIRGSDWHQYRGGNVKEYIHSLVATTLTRLALNKCSHAIVMSKRMASELTEFNDKIKKTIIADPIDVSSFHQMNQVESRSMLGSDDYKSEWVLFNTLDEKNPVKRLDLARAAIEIVKSKYPEVKLKVATGLKYNDMPIFINSCDLVLCTSTHEGWPNSIKEALACGLPFVSTDVSDLREISINYKTCKVTNDEPAEIAKAIMEVLSSNVNENYNEILNEFDIFKSTKKYINLYDLSEKSIEKRIC